MAVAVAITPEAREQFEGLPTVVKARVARVFERLADWPDVSGAKPLRGRLAGQYRSRTGDYRVPFAAGGRGGGVLVVKVGHRDGFYDE